MSADNPVFLRNTLFANAVFSGLGGAFCLIAAGPLTQFLGLTETYILYTVGVVLLVFAADVALTARQKPINPLFAKLIIAADLSWVIASFVVSFAFTNLVSFEGSLLIEGVALVVLGFAVAQTIGLKQLPVRVQTA